jgi:hypothetical protein
VGLRIMTFSVVNKSWVIAKKATPFADYQVQCQFQQIPENLQQLGLIQVNNFSRRLKKV